MIDSLPIFGSMERNMDLVREILLRIEQYNPREHGGQTLRIQLADLPQRFQSLDKNILAAHIDSMVREGLIEDANPGLGIVFGLTWKGWDYLDEIRDPAWFEKLKKRLNPQRPHTLEYIRKVNKKLHEAQNQILLVWLTTIINGLVVGGLWWLAYFCGWFH